MIQLVRGRERVRGRKAGMTILPARESMIHARTVRLMGFGLREPADGKWFETAQGGPAWQNLHPVINFPVSPPLNNRNTLISDNLQESTMISIIHDGVLRFSSYAERKNFSVLN